jgi:hypothetical protein
MKSPKRASAALHFRAEIEKAEAAGVPRGDMRLHLTLNDVNALKRDRSLPLADISFSGGTMRYLGVDIVQGGVSASTLHAGDPSAIDAD